MIKYAIIHPQTKLYWNGSNWASPAQAMTYSNRETNLPTDGMWVEVQMRYPRYNESSFDVV